MKYRVTVFAPDQHVAYDGDTPDQHGVGGGVTVRIRTAQALARLGHEVTVVCNCPVARRVGGVHYRRLGETARIEADIVILNSSAGAPDLRPVLAMPITARLTIVRVDGTAPPAGLHDIPYDYVYAPSNFVRLVARDEWGVLPTKLAVFHHGVETRFFKPLRWPWTRRDPFRLVYVGHPDKGLQPAVGVLNVLRRREPRFQLHAYGGDGLYGKRDQPVDLSPGVVYHGTIGQRRLFMELSRASVALALQARQEPFGLVVSEAKAAGCLVIASPVGAYPEIIRQGHDGFLIPGTAAAPETSELAASLILDLTRSPRFADYLRENARSAPPDWETVARAWEDHWNWAWAAMQSPHPPPPAWLPSCSECGGLQLAIADGYHCTSCGLYRREL